MKKPGSCPGFCLLFLMYVSGRLFVRRTFGALALMRI